MAGQHRTRTAVSLGVIVACLALAGCTAPTATTPTTTRVAHPANDPNGPTARLLAQDRAAVLGQFPHAKIPVEKVRHTVTLDEAPQVTADCYTSNGVAAAVKDGGVYTKVEGTADDEKTQIVRIICESEYPLMDKYNH